QVISAKMTGLGAYVTKDSTVTVAASHGRRCSSTLRTAADAVTCRVPLGCASVRECIPRKIHGSGWLTWPCAVEGARLRGYLRDGDECRGVQYTRHERPRLLRHLLQ